jgi:hypothetical protein
MKLAELFERVDTQMRVPQTRFVNLYYGCCKGEAESIATRGFTPSPIGKKFITLASTAEMAEKMAGFRDCDAVVAVTKIPANYLQINFASDNHPTDIWEAIYRINAGEELTLKLVRKLGPGSFEYINKLRKQQ